MRYHREFDDADAFIREATEAVNEQGWNYWSGSLRPRFHGCSSVEEAKRLAKFGWPQGREAVERMKALIESGLGRRGRTFKCKWDVEGAIVDVGAYVSGEPECMVTFEEVEETKVGFVDIHFSAGVHAGIETEEMVRSGAAVCALIDALENMGRRVRLRWERSSTADGEVPPTLSVSVVLKDYSQPLDMDRVAFFLTSPCARRPLAWSVFTLAPKAVREKCELGPGSIGTGPANHPKYKDAEVWISGMIGGTDAAAARWVLDKLAELGVSVQEAA